MTNVQELKKLAAYIEEMTDGAIALTSYRPGDGVTRYRIGRTSAADGRHDYFGDYGIMRALGAREAVIMCWSFIAGLGYRP